MTNLPYPSDRRVSSFLNLRLITLLRPPYVSAILLTAVIAFGVRLWITGISGLGYNEAGYALGAWKLLYGTSFGGQAYLQSAPGYSQVLSLALLAFGASDPALRFIPVIAGIGTVLLCMPLAKVIGKVPATVSALLFALLPTWAGVSSTVSPDGTAVFLALLAFVLMTTHVRMASTLAGALLSGYLLASGSSGVWLSALCLITLALTLGSRYTHSRLLGSTVSFLVGAATGLTTFFTRPPTFVSSSGLSRAGSSSWGWTHSIPLAAGIVILAIAAFVLLFMQSSQPRQRLTGTLVLTAAILNLLMAILPGWIGPSPVVVLLPLTLGIGMLASEIVEHIQVVRCIPQLALAALCVIALGAIQNMYGQALASTPEGLAVYTSPPAMIKNSLLYVRKVSSEVYRNDRDNEHPAGGTQLVTQIQPALSNWAFWYLRDLDNVSAASRPSSGTDVFIARGRDPRTYSGYHKQVMVWSTGPVSLYWKQSIWKQINPLAGSSYKPKSKYNLFSGAPPGNRPGQLYNPSGIALGPDGKIYVVDQGNNRVEKYDRKGRFIRQWGSAGSGDGQFADSGENLGPTGIAASDRYVWVADTWNHRIEQFTVSGKFVRAWGSYQNTYGKQSQNIQFPTEFYGPRGIALGKDGLLYITDTGNKRVVVYTQNGKFVRQWGTAGNGPAQLNEPVGIAVSREGKVFVADARNQRVQVFNTNGHPLGRFKVNLWAGQGRLEPYIGLDRYSDVYITDPTSGTVTEYSASGSIISEYSGGDGGSLDTPLGIAVKPNGEVYIVDSNQSSVIHLQRLG